MATSKEYALFVENQFRGLEGFALKRMFGEYGMYLQGRVLGFLADEQILLQSTPTAMRLLPEAERRELFPGSKLFIVFPDEGNSQLLKSVSMAMLDELEFPKPRKSAKARGQSQEQVPKDATKQKGKAPCAGALNSDDSDINDFLDFYRSEKRLTPFLMSSGGSEGDGVGGHVAGDDGAGTDGDVVADGER